MVKHMKHIKLFENWAEELNVPEYLDPSKQKIYYEKKYSYTIFHPVVKNQIEYWDSLVLSHNFKSRQWGNGVGKIYLNLKSFSEIPYEMKDFYEEIEVSQLYSKYKLEDCLGIPDTPFLTLMATNIKSLKGLENKTFGTLYINGSLIQNLKYSPIDIKNYRLFSAHNLLSYYGISFKWNMIDFSGNWCEQYYKKYIENTFNHTGMSSVPEDVMQSFYDEIKPHAEAAALMENESIHIYGRYEKPENAWDLLYHDPSNVDNYEFLFIPFWEASEKFREKAQEHLGAINLSGVTRGKEELW